MINELILLSGTTPEEVAARQEQEQRVEKSGGFARLIRVESAGSNEERCGQCSVISKTEHCYLS